MAYRIVLDRRTKTIKIVNRRNQISLKHGGKKGDKGDKGDQGDKGDTGVSTMVRAKHDANASYARPDATYVEWMGSVAPLNATTVDTWIVTP